MSDDNRNPRERTHGILGGMSGEGDSRTPGDRDDIDPDILSVLGPKPDLHDVPRGPRGVDPMAFNLVAMAEKEYLRTASYFDSLLEVNEDLTDFDWDEWGMGDPIPFRMTEGYSPDMGETDLVSFPDAEYHPFFLANYDAAVNYPVVVVQAYQERVILSGGWFYKLVTGDQPSALYWRNLQNKRRAEREVERLGDDD